MNEIKYRVLSPKDFSGNVHGDFGYQINGTKSSIGYVSRKGARSAMHRALDKMDIIRNEVY